METKFGSDRSWRKSLNEFQSQSVFVTQMHYIQFMQWEFIEISLFGSNTDLFNIRSTFAMLT